MDVELEKLEVKSIERHSWALKLRESVLEYVDQSILNWCQVVLQLGHEEIELDEWLNIFKRSIKERCNQLLVNVSDMKRTVIDDIAVLNKKFESYCRQLDMTENLSDMNPNIGYYLVKKQVLERTERLEKIIQERKEQLDCLIRKQQQLCTALGTAPHKVTTSPLLSSQKIKKLQQYVDELEQEKFEREEKYLAMKENIKKMAVELDFAARTDFEREILTISKTTLDLDISKSNMERFEKFQNDLSNQLNEEIDALKGTAENLWTIIEESMTERDNFLDSYSTYSVNTLKALRSEVKRCEGVKKEKIKICVEKLRVQLRTLWQNCYHQSEEELPWYTTDVHTEDLLAYHEMELNKWKSFYSRNKKLIQLIADHEELWGRLLEMQNKESEGLNRYKNRGGVLLKEEREHNKLTKKIPLIEAKIKELATDYANYHEEPFCYCGTPILVHIDQLYCQRKEERKLKLSARKQAREKELLTSARSCPSLFLSSPSSVTPDSATKRKLNNTPTSGKKAKVTTDTNTFKTSVNLNRSRRLSRDKNRRIAKCRKLLQPKDSRNKQKAGTSRMTECDDFENNVPRMENNCRSTVNALDPRTPLEVLPAIVVIPDTPGKLRLDRKGKRPRSAT